MVKVSCSLFTAKTLKGFFRSVLWKDFFIMTHQTLSSNLCQVETRNLPGSPSKRCYTWESDLRSDWSVTKSYFRSLRICEAETNSLWSYRSHLSISSIQVKNSLFHPSIHSSIHPSSWSLSQLPSWTGQQSITRWKQFLFCKWSAIVSHSCLCKETGKLQNCYWHFWNVSTLGNFLFERLSNE